MMSRWISRNAVLALSVGLLVGGRVSGSDAIETLVLRIGGSHVYDATNVAKVDQPAVQIASTKLVDNPPQIVVTGLREGQATMILWLREPKGDRRTVLIDVVERLPQEIERDIVEILKTDQRFAGAKTKIVGAKVIVYGVPDQTSFEHLTRALKVYEEQALVLPVGPPKLAAELKAILARWPDITVTESGPRVIEVSGTCPLHDEATVRRYIKALGANDFGIVVLDDISVLPSRKRVDLKVTFAEMRRTDFRNLGVDWADRIPLTLNADVTYENQPKDGDEAQGPFSRLVGMFTGRAFTEFGVIINISKTDRFAKIHDDYSILVDDGKKVDYNRSGTVYVPVSGLNSGDLKEVEFGTIMSIKPVVEEDGTVELTVDVTVSALVPSADGQNLTVQKNTSKQTIHVTPGKSIALWDTVQKIDSKAIDAVPGLGKVPVLRGLFRSREFQDNKSKAVIWVQADVLDPDQRRKQDDKAP